MSAAETAASGIERVIVEEGCEAGAHLASDAATRGEVIPEAARRRLSRCLEEALSPIQGVLARACVLAAPLDELPELAGTLIHDERDLVRDAASDALVDRGSEALPVLHELLQSKDRDARWYATEALARERSEEFLPLLVDRLGDDDFAIRWVATNGLLAVGSASIVPILRELARREPSLLFHNAARRVLARVSASPSIHETIEKLVDSLGRSTTVYQSEGIAAELLERLLGERPEAGSEGETDA